MTPVFADGAEWLLVTHILGGASALLAALVAFSAKGWNVAHRWHVSSGRFFFWSMVLVIATALPLAIRARNMFLLLIGLFSFYLAWSGWRYAKRRRAAPYRRDRVAAALMAATSLAMMGYGVAMLVRGDYLGVALIVFGAIGGSLCAADLRGKQGDERARIASHLTRMLAATIATLTAFLVTNVKVEPAIVIWLLPTIVITPVIALWNRRIMSGYRPQGMPSGDPGAHQS
jgi:hypothetical protein